MSSAVIGGAQLGPQGKELLHPLRRKAFQANGQQGLAELIEVDEDGFIHVYYKTPTAAKKKITLYGGKKEHR